MKNRAFTSIVCKAFCGLMLLLSPICSFGQDSAAEALYKAGMHALNTTPHRLGPERDRHLTDAKENLSQSFEKLKNPMTAYALAFVYALSEDGGDAKIYAKEALISEPKLPPDFLIEAQKILEWAQAVEMERRQAVETEMEFHGQPAPPALPPGYEKRHAKEIDSRFKRPARMIWTKS
jgi:hypothetical protein